MMMAPAKVGTMFRVNESSALAGWLGWLEPVPHTKGL